MVIGIVITSAAVTVIMLGNGVLEAPLLHHRVNLLHAVSRTGYVLVQKLSRHMWTLTCQVRLLEFCGFSGLNRWFPCLRLFPVGAFRGTASSEAKGSKENRQWLP